MTKSINPDDPTHRHAYDELMRLIATMEKSTPLESFGKLGFWEMSRVYFRVLRQKLYTKISSYLRWNT
jgi:hypothetical protein